MAKHAAILFDKQWLSRYPRPLKVGHNNGTEFMGSEFQEMCHSYNIEPERTTVKNPQAQALVERIHLTMGEILE